MPAFALTFLPLVAFLPSAERPALAPRIAVGLVTGAIGLPMLVRLVVQRDRAAMVAAGLLGWGLLGASVSGSWLTWSGEFSYGTGALFVLTLGGYWAIGRALPEEGIRYAATGFVAGAVLNAVIAMAQGPLDLGAYSLYLYDDRSTGLFANPLYLGATVAAAVALLPLLARARPWIAVGAAFVLVAGAQMSGGRIVVALAVVAGLWGAVRLRGLVGAALVVALVLGLAAGTVLPGNREETAGSRLTDPTSGLDSRTMIWRTSFRAAAADPLLGTGPGRFLAATESRVTLAQARIDGPDRIYLDAHNLFAQYAATMGFVGLALLAGWLVLIGRAARPRAHPEMLGAAAVLLAFHMVEPHNAVLTPLMFMLAGAAAARPTTPWSRVARPLVWLPAAAAALVAIVIVAGDVTLHRAVIAADVDGVRTAAGLLRPWAEPRHAETSIHVFNGTTSAPNGSRSRAPAELRAARASALQATRREPDDWRLHVELGGVLRLLDDRAGAAAAYAEALRHNPWSHLALTGRASTLEALQQTAAAAACRRLDTLLLDDSPAPDVDRLQRLCFR